MSPYKDSTSHLYVIADILVLLGRMIYLILLERQCQLLSKASREGLVCVIDVPRSSFSLTVKGGD